MRFDTQARIARLLTLTGIDAVAVVPGANLRYYTGLEMHLSERPTVALFSDAGHAMILPELEVPQLAARPDMDVQVFSWGDAEGYAGAFQAAVAALRLQNSPLGVDGLTMRVFEYLAFQAAGVAQIKDVSADLLDIRARKTDDEVDAMRRAIAITEAALAQVVAAVRPGQTERQIADALNTALRAQGSQGLAFEALVQSGPNSGVPHGAVTDRELAEGDFLLIDFGGRYNGYPADITRTFCLGQPTHDMRRIYQTVLAANRAGIAAAQPGALAGDVDRAARQVIEDAGYGEYFIHRTGHGLGLDTHEMPQVAAGSTQTLEAGMVFTVEPGIYVPGLGGVRIEDDVLLTEDGVEVLTRYDRDEWLLPG